MAFHKSLFLLCVGVSVVVAGRSPQADKIEALYKTLGGVGRISDNVLEDASLDVPELVRKYNYPLEEHTVSTGDGYILRMHRIPHGRDSHSTPGGRSVVFLMHGLLSSSADYVLMGPGCGLAYILAEEGFDVWMGNARGNYYSRRHTNLNPDSLLSTAFWSFSWDEIGNIDLPAMIDYTLRVSGRDRLHYVGHSQGTTSFFVMGSLRPDYNAKIISMHALAPVAYMANNQNLLLRFISQYANNIEFALSLIGVGEFLPNNNVMTWAGQALCMDEALFQPVCSNILFLVAGWSQDQHNAPELVRKYNYPLEEHTVTTPDGYILGMHRIPHGRDKNNVPRDRPIVFLMHGLVSSSADFILLGPGCSLAYILAEEGFDVWLGNARGNYYSRRHTRLNPDSWFSTAFWQFSWDEIGNIDLPAMIDYALAVTGRQRLHYIGHSQGTTTFFVLGSLRPEYNAKIISMHALAPSAYMEHSPNLLLRFISQFANNMEFALSLLGVGEFFPNNNVMTWAGQALCMDEVVTQILCSNIIFLMGGWNESQHNATMIPVIMGHSPAGASARQFVHYAQSIAGRQFQRYDHGTLLANRRAYGTWSPPRYNLSKITTPVFLHYSDTDPMAHVRDVDRLFRELGRPIGKFRVSEPKFSHFDFIWAIDGKELLYDRIINLLWSMDANGLYGDIKV
ncbi:lipase 3-like [Plodia interpunctella]|uniref:lipase 3-like n=1 Tax=Plodia interpunctella TaxID=58824 RepID=UPI00236769C6|nr:lipase 3-like [Plodia interpunctella]